MTINTHEILDQARLLIGSEKDWCQGTPAKNASGEVMPAIHPNAIQWCALGAIRRATHDKLGPESRIWLDIWDAMDKAAMEIDPATDAHSRPPMTTLNDTTNHETVMRAFNLARKYLPLKSAKETKL